LNKSLFFCFFVLFCCFFLLCLFFHFVIIVIVFFFSSESFALRLLLVASSSSLLGEALHCRFGQWTTLLRGFDESHMWNSGLTVVWVLLTQDLGAAAPREDFALSFFYRMILVTLSGIFVPRLPALTDALWVLQQPQCLLQSGQAWSGTEVLHFNPSWAWTTTVSGITEPPLTTPCTRTGRTPRARQNIRSCPDSLWPLPEFSQIVPRTNKGLCPCWYGGIAQRGSKQNSPPLGGVACPCKQSPTPAQEGPRPLEPRTSSSGNFR
jgi:hypothetical protein